MSPSIVVDRARALFDIYSTRPSSRGAVAACLALSVGLLWRDLRTGSAAGALPLLVLLWANHVRFLATVDALLARRAGLVIGIPMLVFVARLVQFPPTAVDDLLRHIAVAFRPGGYADMYVETSLPPVPLYPGFDAAVGALARSIGPIPTMWAMQALALASFVGVFAAIARRLLVGHPMAAPLTLAALVVVLQVMSGRIFLARPEFFVTVWALAALLARSFRGALLWSAAGVALSTAYWLSPVYFPAAILLPGTRRFRLAVFTGLLAAWAAVWWSFAGGAVVDAMLWTFTQVGRRLPGLRVDENLGIVGVMLMPQMLLLAFGALWALARGRGDGRLLVLAAWFIASNQVRYGGAVAPLLALYLLPATGRLELRWPRHARAAAVALGAVSLSMLAADVPKLADLPRFKLPSGATVLSSFSPAAYSTPFVNHGTVRSAPAFEVGAATPAVQRLVLAIGRGEMDCDGLVVTQFTHVIENRLRGPAPGCLALNSTQGAWRLWNVVR